MRSTSSRARAHTRTHTHVYIYHIHYICQHLAMFDNERERAIYEFARVYTDIAVREPVRYEFKRVYIQYDLRVRVCIYTHMHASKHVGGHMRSRSSRVYTYTRVHDTYQHLVIFNDGGEQAIYEFARVCIHINTLY